MDKVIANINKRFMDR